MLPLFATAVAKVAATTTTIPLAAQTTDHSIFNPIAKPIADVLAAFYSLVPNFGVAIILLSIAWMIVIAPLTLKSTRSMLAMQKLQPQLKKLQAEHKNDRQAFAAAQMELFKEHSVSPFGSCLPTLLPLPVFFALFRVIDGLSHHTRYQGKLYPDPNFLSHHTQMYTAIVNANGHINAFGLDLSKNALSGHSSFGAALPFYVLLLIMIGTQYLQTAQMMSRNPAANDNPQMKMMKYLPIFFGVVCVRFPAGVILYYAMSNICRMTQQTAMYRWDPKVKTLAAREVIEVEAITRDIDRRAGAKGTRKPDDTPPARTSRFRDALNQATKQAAEGRDKKAAGGATPPGKPKPGTAKSGPPPGARPAAAKARPPTGSGTKGAPTPSQPAKARNRSVPPGTKPAPAPSQNGSSQNGSSRNGSGQNGSGQNGSGENGSAAKPGQNGAKPPASKAPVSKVPVPKAPGVKSSGATNGNGNTAPRDGSGNGDSASTNGNGASAAPASTGNGSSGTPGASKPPGTGAGRTGASQPRTPPRKRRGR